MKRRPSPPRSARSLMFVLAALLVAPPCSAELPAHLPVNETRVLQDLEELAAKHNDLEPPSVQRILYTPADMSARDFVQRLMHGAGLQTRFDAVGNLFGTWQPSSDGATSRKYSPGGVLTGSHIDAIPHSGMFDGTLGVLAAIEAVRTLRATGFAPARAITVVSFTAEEPTRFGLSCLGSRVLSGAVDEATLAGLTDANGTSFEAARSGAGYVGAAASAKWEGGEFEHFVELHIEQADSLERSGVPIGAVTAIAAPAALSVAFTGDGGHAGSLRMAERNDALAAAAELVLAVEQAALRAGSGDSVATVGQIEAFPGAANSVPREARVSVDVRDIDGARRDKMVEYVRNAAREIGARRGVGVRVDEVNKDDPATCDEAIVAAVEAAAGAEGLQSSRLVSRAYHDALFVARRVATGMVFVPCRGGVSHRPDEFVEARAVRDGAAVLARVLADLAGEAARGGDDVAEGEGKSEL